MFLIKIKVMKKIYSFSVFALLFFCSFAIKAQVIGDPLETLLAVVTPATTATSNNGAIDLTVVGGFLPLVIEWSNGATTEDISNLAPGLYTVHVYDRYCGVIYFDVLIVYCNGPAFPFTITETHSNTALGSNDGKIDITVSGISPGNYQYYWTKSPSDIVISTNEDISGLSSGTYCVRVVDACGAQAQHCVVITTCQIEYKGSAGITRPCLGLSNGAIDLKTTGVQSFLWSNGATTEDINGISAGTYTVTMTDAAGCSVVHTQTLVNNPPAFTIQSVIEAACPPGQGGSGGSIDLTIGGGTGPFAYAWNNGATSQDVSDLTFGIYRVTITDGNGCQAINLFSIGERNLIIEAGLNHPCTANEPSGAINLYITDNGFSPYTYEWSNGATTKNISGLLPGNYCITITDADGCEDVSCYSLSTQNSIQIEVVRVNNISNCHTNTCTGSVDIKITPSGFYEYEWRRNSNNALVGTSQDVSGLCEGYYTVTVINGNGCEKTQTVRVCCCNSTNAQINPPPHPELCDSEQSSDLPPITITATTAPLSNPPIFYGSISINATGGNGDFYTSWSTGATNVASLNNLTPGVYSVTVSDGCKSATKSITIYDCGDINADAIITGIVKPCGGLSNGTIFIRVPDPNGQPISLTRNGIPVSLPTSGYPQTIGIAGLPTGDNDFILTIGLCDIEFSKKLTSGNSQTFVEFDNGDCEYNDTCNGVVVGTTTVPSNMIYGMGYDTNWGTKCYIPVWCGSNFIQNRRIGKTETRGYMYLQAITQALNLEYIDQMEFDELMSEFNAQEYTFCSEIKYCPGNFKISNWSSTSSH
jgi:SprB repeat